MGGYPDDFNDDGFKRCVNEGRYSDENAELKYNRDLDVEVLNDHVESILEYISKGQFEDVKRRAEWLREYLWQTPNS